LNCCYAYQKSKLPIRAFVGACLREAGRRQQTKMALISLLVTTPTRAAVLKSAILFSEKYI